MINFKQQQVITLQNKTVVITGASSGAGRAAAIEFAKHKAKIVLAARNMEALQQLVNECTEFGAAALAVPTDVTDATAMKQLAAKAKDFGGNIDVWINNAGVLAAGEFSQTPVEVHHRVIQTNLLGYINGAHAVLPYFKQQQHGILINNISVGAWFPVPYGVAYSASKFGLLGFTQALRAELIKWKRIYVCDLFPAFLDTPGIQHAANYTGKILKPAPPVYNPQRVGKSMVKIALNPRNNVTVGSIAYMLRAAHLVAPSLSGFFTAKVMETYFKVAKATPASSGNLFEPVRYGTSIHGGWSLKAQSKNAKNIVVRAGMVASLIMAVALIAKNNK